MPRLLPRLLKAIQERPLVTAKRVTRHAPNRKTPRSLYRPTPDPSPTLRLAGRTRSFLLDPNSVTDKRAFARHKRLPPRVRLGPRHVAHEEHDVPREMTTQEREWWSSPYLRMLATPLRQCTISKRYMPNDFLIRLAVLRLEPSTQHENGRSTEILMPDGLEHPKYKQRKARVAVYVSCWKDAVQTMKSPGGGSLDPFSLTSLTRPPPWSSVSLPRHTTAVHISKHLCSHVGYLLRLRVLQELDVLIDALKQRRKSQIELQVDADPTVLRRLTRAEFSALRETGTIPFPDAVAVLVVPPVNRDPRTGLRPRPSREPVISSSELANSEHEKALPPLSSLHDVDRSLETPTSTLLPSARVPQYNGLTLFPHAPHRAEFHSLLTELLNVERRFRGPTTTTTIQGQAKGDAKGSHAFLLLSNAETVKRADSAALAIALWRLSMWEGDAFADKVEGWEIGKQWRVDHCSRL